MISLIVAMSKNRVIGVNNSLPWKCSEDLKHFKALTMGHTIIMGRKTYDSIGKPLPGRHTIVVSRNKELIIEGCVIENSIGCAIMESLVHAPLQDIFIVGGAEIYKQSMEYVDRLFITEIQEEIEGDAYFPEIDLTKWKLIYKKDSSQEKPPLTYKFLEYVRN